MIISVIKVLTNFQWILFVFFPIFWINERWVHFHCESPITKYRAIHKSVKYFKNSQQIDYATDHDNSYVDLERNCLSFFFFKEKPAHIVALICR